MTESDIGWILRKKLEERQGHYVDYYYILIIYIGLHRIKSIKLVIIIETIHRIFIILNIISNPYLLHPLEYYYYILKSIHAQEFKSNKYGQFSHIIYCC